MSLSRSLHPRRSLVTTLVAVTTAALLLPLTAFPAAAAPLRAGGYYERPAPYDDRFEFDPECADVDVTVTGRARGVFSIRHVIGSGRQAFLGKDRFRLREVWTDTATGEVLFRYRAKKLFQEVSARRVAKSAVPRRLVPDEGLKGPVFEFTAHETGAGLMRDGDGEVMFWEGGKVEYTNLFDTRGDHEPGGISLRFEGDAIAGRHPLLDVDFCDIAAEQAAALP